eukprot:gene6525-13206_t
MRHSNSANTPHTQVRVQKMRKTDVFCILKGFWRFFFYFQNSRTAVLLTLYPLIKSTITQGENTMSMVSDTILDNFEKNIRDKVNVATGFAGDEANGRKLKDMFKYFDINHSGFIDYQKFVAAMANLNFVGVQREVDALFNRYDVDASGMIDYEEMSFNIFGFGTKPNLDRKSRAVIEKMRISIMTAGGASGFHRLKAAFLGMDSDGSRTLDRVEFNAGFKMTSVSGITSADIDVFFHALDRERSGKLLIDEVMRVIQDSVDYERKKLIREVYNTLDKSNIGYVEVVDILNTCDFSLHPNVADGNLTYEDAAHEMLATFVQGDTKQGRVTWLEFLEYFKGISLVIGDNDYFETVLRKMWNLLRLLQQTIQWTQGSTHRNHKHCNRPISLHEMTMPIQDLIAMAYRNKIAQTHYFNYIRRHEQPFLMILIITHNFSLSQCMSKTEGLIQPIRPCK